MKRTFVPQRGTSLVLLLSALVLSACGGGDAAIGGHDVAPYNDDMPPTAATALGDGKARALAGSDPVAMSTSLASENTFERAEWNGTSVDGMNNKLECKSSLDRSTEAHRAGDSSIRFQTGLQDIVCPTGRYRAEVSVANGTDRDYVWDDPTVHWVGLSIYPRKFDNPAYSLLQIHAPNEKGKCDYAGNAVSIKPVEVNGTMHYALYVILDGSKVRDRSGGAFAGTVKVWSEPMNTKGFTDFVVSFTLSTKKQGTVKFWRNGELVYSASGLTDVNYIDSCGNRIPNGAHNGPHVGIYGPPAHGDSKERATYGNPYREVFIDQLRTANGPDGYALVDPSR